VYVPTPMVGEPFFSVSATITPIVQGNIVVEPVVDSPVPNIMNLLEDLRGPEGRLSLNITRFMLAKKFKWRVIPPLLKKP
jgi:hypothetical protein